MSMEFKEVAEFLGYNPDEIKSLDDFKTKFNAEFLRRNLADKDDDIVKRITGARMGSIETVVKRAAKELGLELTADQLKDKKVEDILDFVSVEAKKQYSTQLAEKDRLLAENNKDEIVKSWSDKYSKLEGKLKDTIELLDVTKRTLDEQKSNHEKAIKEFKLNLVRNEAFKKVSFIDGITPLQQKGFNTLFDEKYALDFDENGEIYISTKADQKRIPNPKVAGKFLTPDEVIQLEADENGLLKKNPGVQQQRQPIVQQQQQQQQQPGGGIDDPRRVTYDER